MRCNCETSVMRPLPAMIEGLEGRAYLSAAPVTVPAIATPAPASHPVRASVSGFIPREVNKPVPHVDLTPHITGIVKRNVNGKTITIQLIVNNAGPDTAKGSLRVGIEFSIYRNGASPRPFRTINTPIKIVAGGSKTIRITSAIPKSYPAFDYHMIAILNGNKSIPETNYTNNTELTASYFYLA